MTHTHAHENEDYGFLTGLVAGGVIGAGLAMYFAPRAAAELRTRGSGSARNLGDATIERFQRASARVGEALDHLATKRQGVRDEVCDAVARGADDVERYAIQAGTAPDARDKRPLAWR
jgi:gas vesicle protein